MSTIEYITAEELRVDTRWWEIYEESFPASEREPPDVILESALSGVGMVFRARQGARTLGLATIHLLKNPAAVFLVYLAVSKKERSQGIGAELFDFSLHAGSARLREQHLEPCGMVWEIDPPEEGDGAASGPQRRIAFFQKHGGHLLDHRYVQPPVDGIAGVPMLLMFRPGNGQEVPNSSIVDAMVRAIYFEKYGAINRIDGSILKDLLSP